MKNYRKNSMYPSAIRLAYLESFRFEAVAKLAMASKSAMVDEENYSPWLRRWRMEYAELSASIRLIKASLFHPDMQKYHEALKKLANTMLNVRQEMKDYRRAYFEKHAKRDETAATTTYNDAHEFA